MAFTYAQRWHELIRGLLAHDHRQIDGAVQNFETRDRDLEQYLAQQPPVGMVTAYAGDTAPSGWLLCDGAAIGRATYPQLFTLLGETFGAGDGSTTFNLPDLRQRFVLGLAAAGTGAVLGETGGTIDQALSGSVTTTSAGAHGHATDTQGAHTHDGHTSASTFAITGASKALIGPDSHSSDGGHAHTAASGGAHTHDLDFSGGSGLDNPPYIALAYIIRVG